MDKEIFNKLPKGLYSADGSFRSDQTIKRELALEGQVEPVYKTPLVKQPSLKDYLQRAEDRKQAMKEAFQVSDNHVELTLPETSTVNFMGDLHFGNPNTDNKRIQQEIEVIKNTPNSFVMLMGDLVDGIFWGGASQSEQNQTLSEQHGFLRAMFKELRGKIIAGVSGEHDSKWASKSGSDPYDIMTGETGAPYIRGIAEIGVNIGNFLYKIVGAHKMRGHSMYNKNHPTFRMEKFGIQGADVYVSAHNHQKQIAQETLRGFNEAREVTHVAIGPYKDGDEYGDRSGFSKQKKEEMYGAAIRLHKKEKKVDVEKDIIDAVKRWSNE